MSNELASLATKEGFLADTTIHFVEPENCKPIFQSIWLPNNIISAIKDESSPTQNFVINPFYCYTGPDIYLILKLRLEEEKHIWPGLLDNVFSFPAIRYSANPGDLEGLFGTHFAFLVCTDFVHATEAHLRNTRFMDQRLLLPALGDLHAIAVVIDIRNRKCSRVLVIDSGGATEYSTSSRQALENKLKQFLDWHNSTASIEWYAGIDQWGGTCTVYSIENLILAAHDKLRLSNAMYKNPLLLRLHHMRLVWRTRHSFPNIEVERAGVRLFVDIFEDFQHRQIKDTPLDIPKSEKFLWKANAAQDDISDFEPARGWVRDRNNDFVLDESTMASSCKRLLFLEALLDQMDAECIFTTIDSAFSGLEHYKKPVVDDIYHWLDPLETLNRIPDNLPEDENRAFIRSTWNEKTPTDGNIDFTWRIYFLFFAFSYICDPEQTKLVLNSVAADPKAYLTIAGKFSIMDTYKKAIAYVLSEQRFRDKLGAGKNNATFEDMFKQFCSSIGFPFRDRFS